MPLPSEVPNDREKLYGFLKKQMERQQRMDSPEYAGRNADVAQRNADTSTDMNMAAVLADSAAKAGTLGGKQADASAVSKFAAGQNDTNNRYFETLAKADDNSEKRYGVQQKVLEYLADKEQKTADSDQRDSRERTIAKEKNDTAIQMAGWHNDTMRDNAQTRKEAALEAAAMRKSVAEEGNKTRADARATAAGTKAAETQGKHYVDLVRMAEGGRNAPPAIVQIQKAQTAIGNAQELLNKYPDLNDMQETDVKLLMGELEKVATNGAGTESGREGLNPNTFLQRFNHFKSQLTGVPEGADIAEFLQSNKAYLDGISKAHSKTIGKYRRNLLGGNKGLISPEQEADFKRQYASDFAEDQGPEIPASPHKPDAMGAEAIGAPAVKSSEPVGFVKVLPNGKKVQKAADGMWDEVK